MMDKWMKWIWRPVPFLSDAAVIPILCLLPLAVFLLFVLLISGLSSVG